MDFLHAIVVEIQQKVQDTFLTATSCSLHYACGEVEVVDEPQKKDFGFGARIRFRCIVAKKKFCVQTPALEAKEGEMHI